MDREFDRPDEVEYPSFEYLLRAEAGMSIFNQETLRAKGYFVISEQLSPLYAERIYQIIILNKIVLQLMN